MTHTTAVIVLMACYSAFLAGCGSLEKLTKLTEKSTVEECTDMTTKIVAKACQNIGDVKDRAQILVDNVNIAVDAAVEK